MTTVDQIRAEREAREAEAARIAATLEPGEYFASGNWLMRRNSMAKAIQIHEAATHWDACLIMLATRKGPL